ncbi:MAG TPA: Smr/MutS family protein [Kofleriaceae bacterium]|nr:Smr/MutS family protein [Kofleriaceae bacterium]
MNVEHDIAAGALADVGWPQVASALASRCATDRGAGAALALPLAADRAEAQARFALIAELCALAERGQRLAFGGITDVRELAMAAKKGGVLEPDALWVCAEAARGLDRLRKSASEHAELVPGISVIAAGIADLSQVSEAIFAALIPGGGIADGASQDLGPLRRRAENLASELAGRARAFASDPALASALQDRFVTEREGRLVVPVRSDNRGRVRGIVHAASQSGQTLYIEPEALIDAGNQLKLARIAVADEEARILAALSRMVGDSADAIDSALAIATRLDVTCAGARLAADVDAAPFELTGGDIDVSGLRHPLIVLAQKPCVANDVRARAGAALLISGPNAGGKTVAMTAIGLAAVMARMGLGVCADRGAKVPWLTALGTDIGDRQSLESDLSTFSAHLLKLCELCAGARPGALILVDEIGAGTDPDQGSALAQAVLEALTAAGATVIATTHSERLKEVAAGDARFDNASVGFDLARMQPTFKLHLGVPGSSGALALARRMSLPEAVCARAEEILGSGRVGIEALAAQLAEARAKLAEKAQEMETARDDLAAERDRVAALKERARAADEKAQAGAYSGAVAALRAAREELDRARSDIRVRVRRGGAENLAEVDRQIDRVARQVAKNAPAPAEAPLIPADPEALSPGTAVRIGSLRQAGVVISRPERGRVAVQMGNLRSHVQVSDVALATTAKKTGDAASHKTTHWSRSSGEDSSVLDVRGERADDAQRRVDELLDRAILDERETVFIIHGHGSGALRVSLRSHLGAHPLVSRWRAGEPREGGDGVTVVWLA